MALSRRAAQYLSCTVVALLLGSSACDSPSSGESATETAAKHTPRKDAPRPLDDEQLSAGWIALFDGESFFGWNVPQDADWQIEDGTIKVSKGQAGLLTTTAKFADYELHVEFQSAAGTNSGIFLRTPVKPKDPASDCYELNIAPLDNPFPTGSLVKRSKVDGEFESEQWQTYDVTVKSGEVVVKLDGKQILSYTDPQPLPAGHIGLQLNQGPVAFRNVWLRPLGLQSLFNGKNLEGWQASQDSKSEWNVSAEGTLDVRGGPGHLESDRQFANFVLQLEAKTNAANLNSGVFFRCIPGEKMNGYESQIHNGFRDQDRTRPMDYGTGGIFRRQQARLVVPDDQQWFHKTIVADGPHMAVWVNGYQVSDWTDDRSADPNPRRGLRVEAGTFMIQGHDPTTDLSFRNLRAVEQLE